MAKHKIIYLENGKGKILDPSLKGELKSKFFNVENLTPTEILYLVNRRNFVCLKNGKKIENGEVFSLFSKIPKIFTLYNVFRDWRDRGLFIFEIEKLKRGKKFEKSPVVGYPANPFEIEEKDFEFVFLEDSFVSICIKGDCKKLYEKYWMGQWSIYKGKDEREKILKIDMIESLYLAKLGFKFFDKNGKELKFEKMVRIVKRKIPEVEDLLDVYEDWREKGYILKTGFKFGAHFRIYFPGASPYKKGKEWIHSKHVLHVFPKNVKMRMSEWARAVRVAHSVRKTFIMGIPKMKKEDYLHEKAPINFFAYHRKGNEIEKPNNASPSFLVMALSEDEELSGKVLASALDRADELGLRLLLAISDRESSVTYYLAKRIELPNSRNKYYEIEWFNP